MNRMEQSESLQASGRNEPEEYDLVIIGSGAGAKFVAWTFGAKGQRVALVERKYIGGSCPNIACLPSKNIIHSAKVASFVRSSEQFGIATRPFKVDMSAVRDRKRRMVADLVDVHIDEFQKSGTEVIMGSARFVGPRTVEATLLDGTTRRLRGRNVVIGTGTHASLDETPGLSASQPLTHVEALELDDLPGHLIVLGAGYVGLEFAQAMRRFGSHVTVIDRNRALLHREDDDVTDALGALFTDEGIDVVLDARVEYVEGRSGSSVKLAMKQSGERRTVEGTHLLVAAGRTPNTENLGLESAGVELTDRGFIKVNERLETTAPGVWAVGEVAGSPQYTHISIDDFRVFHDNVTGGHHVTTGRQVPSCLFTDPELAHVGLSEKEAIARGVPYRLFKIPMAAVLRTRTISETRGFLKALVEADGDRILGFTGFGAGAGEIMASIQVAMIAGVSYGKLRDAIIAHPTFSEALAPLFSSEIPVKALAYAND